MARLATGKISQERKQIEATVKKVILVTWERGKLALPCCPTLKEAPILEPAARPFSLHTARALPLLLMYALTLGLSAFLLFAVQPMFARLILPKLGGAPSVWAVAMCFFQAALLAGYAYAHTLDRFAPPRAAVLIHVCLLLIALLALPIGVAARWGDPPAGDAYRWQLLVMATGVGLPFLAIAATAPLLQSWFARSGHPHASDPYFLYGASNFGSLGALLLYPVLI